MRFVPGFISERLASGVSGGVFGASVAVFDLPGFTRLTGSFVERGSRGAEELSALLNGMLSPAVDGILEAGGIIGGFAGDSVTGIFPGAGSETASGIAQALLERVAGTGPAGQRLPVKCGICEGPVEWRVAAGAERLFHYFCGPAVASASTAQERCEPGGIRTAGCGAATAGCLVREYAAAALPFVPERVLALDTPGEFRVATTVFASPAEPGLCIDHGFVERMLELSELYGGYLSGVDHKSGGPNALVVLGAPVSHEDDSARADSLLRDLFASGFPVRAGVETGLVFSGILGSSRQASYTVIGSSVNLSCRLMYRAGPGEILAGPEFSVRTSLPRSGSTRARYRGMDSVVEAATLSPGSFTEGPPVTGGPFIGREAELALVGRLLSSGGPRVVTVSGEAGTGKSRLAAEVEIRHPDIRFLRFRVDGVLRKAFNPFTRFLKGFFSLSDSDDPEVRRAVFEEGIAALCASAALCGEHTLSAALRRGTAALGSLAGLRWPDSIFERLDPRLRLENVTEAVRSFHSVLCLTQDCVIVLDDAHWLDPDSRALFEALMAHLPPGRTAWMILTRQEEGGELRGSPSGEGTLRIRLEPLSRPMVAELMAEELGRTPSRSLTDFIVGQTGGNPLFVEQYCRFLFEQGLIVERDGRLELGGRSSDLPAGISSVLIARIDRLAARVRNAVHSASVLGREFEVEVLSGMLRGEDVQGPLKAGSEEQIWQSLTSLVYMFRHALLRDAAYSMQLSSRLRELHASAAAAILLVHPGDPEYFDDLAFHYEKAEMDRDAEAYLALAARHASGRFLGTQALDLYDRLLARIPEGPGKVLPLLEKAEVEWNTGLWDEALGTFEDAGRRAAALGMNALAGRAFKWIGRILIETGEREAGREALGRALGFLDLEDDLATRSQITLIEAFNAGGGRSAVLDLYRRGLDLARESGDQEQILRAIGTMGNYHLQTGDFHGAEECYREVIDGADRLGNPQIRALALGNMALACKHMRMMDRAVLLIREQLQLAEEMGNGYLVTLALGNLAGQLATSWDWDEAVEVSRRAVLSASSLKARNHEALARSNLAAQCRRQGMLEEALRNAERAAEIAVEIDQPSLEASILLELADIHLAAGRVGEAGAALERASAIPGAADSEGEYLELLRARVDAAAGAGEPALRVLRRLRGSPRPHVAAEAAFNAWLVSGSDEDRTAAMECCNRAMADQDFPLLAVRWLEEMGFETPEPSGGRA